MERTRVGGVVIVLATAVSVVVGCGRESAPSPTTSPTAPPAEATPDPDGLAFFNDLSGRLQIELTEATEPIAPGLANQKAKPGATIRSLHLEMQVFENDDFRVLTDDEWGRVVFRGARIRLRGGTGKPIAHDAPNGRSFTVLDLARAVAETERRTRGDTEWFGGIDVHHVFFEGLQQQDDGSWAIAWGS